jgi:hypothetical protein
MEQHDRLVRFMRVELRLAARDAGEAARAFDELLDTMAFEGGAPEDLIERALLNLRSAVARVDRARGVRDAMRPDPDGVLA